jgi:hypothetical protein
MADIYVAKSKNEGWKVWNDVSNSWHAASLQDLVNATMTLNDSTGAYVPVDFKSAYNKGDRSGPIEWNAIKNTWVIKYGESLKPDAGNSANSESKKTVTELRVLDENAVEDLLQKISRIVEGSPDYKAELKSFLKDLRGSVLDNLREESQSAAYDLTQALQESYQKLDTGVEEMLEKVSEMEIPSLDYKKELRIFRESLEEIVKNALREELREELKKELKPKVHDSVTTQKSTDILITPGTIPKALESFKKEILEDFKNSVKELGITASQKLEMREKFIKEFEESIKPKLLVDLELDVRAQLKKRIEENLRRTLREELRERILFQEGPVLRKQVLDEIRSEATTEIFEAESKIKSGTVAELVIKNNERVKYSIQKNVWKIAINYLYYEIKDFLYADSASGDRSVRDILSLVVRIRSRDIRDVLEEEKKAHPRTLSVSTQSLDYKSPNVSGIDLPHSRVDELQSDEDEESDFDDDNSEDEEFEQI